MAYFSNSKIIMQNKQNTAQFNFFNYKFDWNIGVENKKKPLT